MKKISLIIICASLWSTTILAQGSTSQLGETMGQVDSTVAETTATEAITEADFQKSCIVDVEPVECNTKIVLGGASASGLTQDKICKTIKCDASLNSGTQAETSCETTMCDPLMAQKTTASNNMEVFCPNPYTEALCVLNQELFTTYQSQEAQCRADCKRCQSTDVNATDGYNNKSVCGGTYGSAYDSAIKKAKMAALKKEKKCRTFCKGKSKINWTKIIGLVAVGSILTQIAKDTKDSGPESSGTVTNNPMGDCSLISDEKKRVICYCEKVSGYEYEEGKGCIPTGTGARSLNNNSGGGSATGAFGNSNNLKGAVNESTDGASGSTTGAGTDPSSSGASGLASSGLGAGGASDKGAVSKKEAKDASLKGVSGKSSGSSSQQGYYGAQGYDVGASVTGTLQEAGSVDTGTKAPVTDIQKKETSLFDSIREKLDEKYKGGTLLGGKV